MRWKTTLALLVVTVGVSAYVSLIELRQPNPEDRGRLAKHILAVQPEAISQLVLDLPNAKVTLTRRSSGWRLAPKDARADEALITRILGELNPLVADRTLTGSKERPLDPKAFGLDPALGWISFVANGTPSTLLFGETTSTGGHRYLKASNRPEIFVVASTLFDLANVSSASFRDPSLVRADAWLTSALTITSPALSLALARDERGWRIGHPFQDLADRPQAEALLRRLDGIRIKRFIEDAPQVEQLATWGFDHPRAEVLLQQPGEGTKPITVFFGKPLPDDASLVYAKRSDEPPLYAVAASDVDALLKDPQTLRSTACFEFFTTDASKVEVARAAGRWAIERVKDQWRERGAETVLENPRVEDFLNTLADLRATGFIDETPQDLATYGLAAPTDAITVWTATQPGSPQRLLIGAAIDGGKERYGRIEGREIIVRLPLMVTGLLASGPEQFRAAPAAPTPPPSPSPTNSTPPASTTR